MALDVSTPAADPSMADLRAMISGPAQAEAKPETAATEPVEAKVTEAVSETAEEQQKPKSDDAEEPLPENVKKRIGKEVERISEIQRKIDQAVSDRKAKEKELADLAKPGSEPAPNTAAKDAKPVKPSEDKFSTWGDYQAALAKYEGEHEAWLIAETERRTEAKLTQRQQEAKAKERWDAAVKVHGAEFPKLMETATAKAPEGLQQAISALDHWSDVAVHLAKNPARLAEVVEKFNANPYAAVAELGRIEASLKSVTKAADPLPKPPVIEGGKSSASTSAFDVETASMSQIRAHLGKLGKR